MTSPAAAAHRPAPQRPPGNDSYCIEFGTASKYLCYERMHYIIFLAIVAPLLCGGIWAASEHMEPPGEFAYKSDDTGLHQLAGTLRFRMMEVSAQTEGTNRF